MFEPVRHETINIQHPLVADAFIETKSKNQFEESILILETRIDKDHFDEYVPELLVDLESFKFEVYQQFGFVKRIDIRTH